MQNPFYVHPFCALERELVNYVRRLRVLLKTRFSGIDIRSIRGRYLLKIKLTGLEKQHLNQP